CLHLGPVRRIGREPHIIVWNGRSTHHIGSADNEYPAARSNRTHPVAWSPPIGRGGADRLSPCISVRGRPHIALDRSGIHGTDAANEYHLIIEQHQAELIPDSE